MKNFKPTKEYMLTPRPCRICGQHMSAELLAKRRFKRNDKISKALKLYRERLAMAEAGDLPDGK